MGSNPDFDLDLNGTYYLLHGISTNTPMAASLVTHEGGANPDVTEVKINLVDSLNLYSGSVCPGSYMLLLVIASLLTLIVNL